jgi:hypothetical protein
VRQLRGIERFQPHIGHATDTEGDQVSEAWLEHLLYIVRVFPHTLDRVSRTKMSLQSWRRCCNRRESVPRRDLGWQAPHDTACIPTQASAEETQ